MRLTYLYLFVLITLISCARRGSPTGGPKDEDAPIIIEAIPSHNSLNFDSKQIRIYFDEYIKLKDVQKQLVISPPLKYKPLITPLGVPSKRLTIKIQDTLQENTTYVFNFGESIEDNNEGNKLSNFKYVFSTGDYIDSLKIRGSIADAFLKKTDNYVSVMLYPIDESYNDSTIYKERPKYIANTLDSLAWEITNIKKGSYKLIALKETNGDYIYDPKEDKIAFIDSVINIPTDQNFGLRLYKEAPEFALKKPLEKSKGHIIFGYIGNGKNLKVQTEYDTDSDFKSRSFFEDKKDTLNYFYKGKELDSITFNVSNNEFSEEQTIKLRLKKIDSLRLESNFRGVLHVRDTMYIVSNNPLENIDESKINLIDKDTLSIPVNTSILDAKKLQLLFDRTTDNKYALEILPGAITDFFDQANDTLSYNFITKKESYYGNISLKVNAKKYPLIIQLLNDNNDSLVEEQYLEENSELKFENLIPSKYRIRIIVDDNNNKKWDAGNYLKNMQPEDVIYYDKVLDVKENWFLNETITLN